jgi:hypothetical protein
MTRQLTFPHHHQKDYPTLSPNLSYYITPDIT